MEKSILLRGGVVTGVFLLVCFPLLHLLFLVPSHWQWDNEFLQVCKRAGLQALVSASLCLVFGFLGGLGLLNFSEGRRTQILRVFCLLPIFLPPLVLVLSVSSVLGSLPTGFLGVVFFHVFSGLGLAAILIESLLRQRSIQWLESALISGISPIRIFLWGILPALRKQIFIIFFYFFILSFFSFSIPLLVGGAQFGGVEVFLYEKILFFGDWTGALQYSLVLFFLLLGLSFCFSSPKESPLQPQEGFGQEGILLNTRFFQIACFAPSILLVIGIVIQMVNGGVSQIFDLQQSLSFLTGLSIGIGAGLVVFVLLMFMAFSFPSPRVNRLFCSLVSPGWVIVAFSFLLLPGESELVLFLKVVLALCLIFFPFLYRLWFFESLESLRNQVLVARTFPVSWLQIVTQIIWPQCLFVICFLSGLAGLWAAGDFGVTGILLGPFQGSTLALEIQGRLDSYRLSGALSLLPTLLFQCLVVFFIFQGIYYVCGQSPQKKSKKLQD